MSNIGRRRATALKQDADTYTTRRREIVDAAAQLFKKNGYAPLSDQVVKRLGSSSCTRATQEDGERDRDSECPLGLMHAGY